jgi:hypothetical protein
VRSRARISEEVARFWSRGAGAVVLAAALFGTACGGATEKPPAEPEDPPEVHVAVALRFVEQPEDPKTRTPRTRVQLVRIVERDGEKQTTDLGTYPGACMHADTSNGVVLRARCWWAGAGTRLVVVRDGRQLVVKRREVDEMTGASKPEELIRIDLPEGAVLDPIRPKTLPVR